MNSTLAAKVIEGIHSQRWTISGYGGTWAGAMRPLEKYVQGRIERAVKVEREACAMVCDKQYPYSVSHTDQRAAKNCAAAIRARGEK